MKITALLTGKQNSTFKNKNEIKLHDEYIFNYPAKQAKKVKEIDFFYTSSDSKVILNQTKKIGYHSINRPKNLAKKNIGPLGAKHLAVTLGSGGVILLNKSPETIYKTPVLSTKVLDRIGAGDAFLSLAGLCLGGRIDSEIALFVGSAAAALDVQVVCNREPISPVSLYKYITTLLKA